MYSRYRYKSKEYKRKKAINKKFSPAAYKNNVPTYYQQKGRIIQSSPRFLYQYPTEVLTQKRLDQMYDALKKAKYEGLNTLSPKHYLKYAYTNIPIQDVFLFDNDTSTTSVRVGSEFCDYICTIISDLPLPTPGYKWGSGLDYILYDYNYNGNCTCRFSLNLVNDWLTNPNLTLIRKNQDTFRELEQNNSLIMLSPHLREMIHYSWVDFHADSVSNEYQMTTAQHVISTNVDEIPLISSQENNFLQIGRDLTHDLRIPGFITMIFTVYQYPDH